MICVLSLVRHILLSDANTKLITTRNRARRRRKATGRKLLRRRSDREKQTSNQERPIINGKQEPPQLKIEIPANRLVTRELVLEPPRAYFETRYDMLCFEGISLMLNIFREKKTTPNYRLVPPPNGKSEVLTALPEVPL